MLTPEELRGIESRVPLRLSDSADVDVLLDERRELLLQKYEAAADYLMAEAKKIPLGESNPQRGFSSTYNALMFCEGILRKASEKPVDEVLRKEAEALLDPKSPGWDAGAERLLKDLKDRKDADKRMNGP